MPSDFFSDTDPQALEVFLSLQRRRTPSQKLKQMFEMTELVLKAAVAGVRQMYPDADEREVFLRAAARRLDPDTMFKVYGWDPRLPDAPSPDSKRRDSIHAPERPCPNVDE